MKPQLDTMIDDLLEVISSGTPDKVIEAENQLLMLAGHGILESIADLKTLNPYLNGEIK